MADHTGSSQVAGPSLRADPVPPPDRDESDSDSVSDRGSTADGPIVSRRQPALEGHTLVFWLPLPTTVECPHADCSAKFRAKVWTSAKQSITRHLRELHAEAEDTSVRCVGCGIVLGVRPGAHKCQVPIEDAADTADRFTCTVAGCPESFPSKQGLTNHLRNHRRIDALAAAAVPLPVPATRQRLRSDRNPRPARGGDARVPEAVDVPRTPAGTRPPATGGTSPLPPTTSTEPRIPAGNIPPDTGGSVSTAGAASGGAPRTPAGDRPPDTGGAPLSPLPTLLPASTRRATPVRPRGVGDRLSLPLPSLPPPRRESPRNEGYNVVIASPELWRPRIPPPTSDSGSDSSGLAPEDDDLLDVPVPELDAAAEVPDDGDQILQPDDTTPLHAFRERFADFSRGPCTEEVWSRFVALVDEMTAEAAVIVKLPVRPEGRSSGNRTAIDPTDAKGIQSLYRRNRRRAVRLILSGEGQSCEVPVPAVEEHFRRTWAPSACDPSIYARVDGRDPVPMGPLQYADVSKRLGKFENTAPGDDGLTYRHWKRLDPECTVLTGILNTCLRFKRVPPAWKKAVTILIYKKGAKEDLTNWRPISLSRTLYKLYVGCVAGRLTEWLVANNVLSPCQKGFLPADGAFEHVHTLNRVLEKARTHAADKCVAWLDVSNAFGAIPHPALEAAIQASGAGEDLLLAVRDIYSGATSSVSVAGGMTGDIPVRSGIKQGCPLSGLLFIMAIDPVVARLQGASADHRVLAFADDLCLIADSPGDLQSAIDAARVGLGMIGLKLNANKCASLHLSGKRPVGVRDTQFRLLDSPLRPLVEGEAATFLGAQVGFNIVPPLSTLAEITEIGLKISRSKLAPWQRIDALKTFFYPSTVHLQRMGTFPKGDWARVDKVLRPEIKATLYLPQEASGEYIYGSTRRGCCGIRLLAEDADIAAVDSAFKLVSSPDLRVAEDAAEHVEEVTRRRICKVPTIHEVASYLSGEDEGVFRESRGTGVSSVWSRARNASKRLGVKWSLDGAPAITHGGAVMGRKQRRAVMRTVRDTLRLGRSDALIAKPDQGRAVECAAAHAASTHFLKEGDFTRFADWRFVHRARLNLVPLNGSSSWRVGDRRCRRCGYTNESLAHVVDHCMRYTGLYMARHNSVVARIKKAASARFEVLSENQALGDQGLRPDLVLKKGPNLYIVDVTVPFDNRLAAFEVAAAEKRTKYEELRAWLAARHGCEAVVVPFVVGALGSWDPANDVFLRKLCSRSYGTLFRKLCVSDAIAASRDIYIEHLSGVRQVRELPS
ncbi:uncharacterized protein LOC132951368 [Metopolophium dirhodum]|uniref:uncharacterized protein LOC132951368 n=1 Tax=Metopolophium dirhodum TaxID=44670 RepID=UPI00298FE6E0|nr:uncharacterized protein LOC132951368 [Metopolophium dirhodum]